MFSWRPRIISLVWLYSSVVVNVLMIIFTKVQKQEARNEYKITFVLIERRKDSIISEPQNLPVWVETHTLTETQYVSDLTLFQKRLCVNLISDFLCLWLWYTLYMHGWLQYIALCMWARFVNFFRIVRKCTKSCVLLLLISVQIFDLSWIRECFVLTLSSQKTFKTWC